MLLIFFTTRFSGANIFGIKLKTLVTHRFKLTEIQQAYDLFANQRDGVLKVAISP